ncbi:MAG: hypothetical protein ACHQQS_15985 [Thermoanaerobaculales bacterium]
MRLVIGCLAGLIAYPVASWLVRLAVTVLTLPLAGVVREAESRLASRVLRVAGGAICGGGGLVISCLVLALLGAPRSWLLPGLIVAYVAFAHVPGLRRLAGGPQVGDEALSFIGEELGVVAAAIAIGMG